MTVSTKGKPRLGVMRRVAPLIAAGIMACFAPLAAAAVPNPVVTGPIPARSALGHPSHDYPWMATHLNLAASGYVEEE